MRSALMCGLVLVAAVACSQKKQPPVAAHSPLADSADQVMYGMRFVLTDKGLNRALLQSDTAYFFDENTRIELEKVHTTFFTATGAKNALLTSARGRYNSRTNNMVARTNVVVTTEDGRRLTTPELNYNQQTNQISSDSAFVLTEPNRRLEGVGFRSDPDMKNIQILKGASGMAKGVSTQPTAPIPDPNAAPRPIQPAPVASSTPRR
ncbi:MAG TPA: LPS export ABC transporter periplasmic protein LptC [Gemmatimonadaceae bacterium]|nr:LPS export ABC transporter periplasmic protein LptC [Gemmatimonadaceae bacterium]